MFIYAFLSEGLGQFSFQLTPPVVRPGGRVNVIPPPPTVPPTYGQPQIRTQYQVLVFYKLTNWIINPRHTRYFQSAGEAVAYFNALCEQGRAVGGTYRTGGRTTSDFFTTRVTNLPTRVELSRWAPPADGWTVINRCDS
jgi:hypothetical protein